MKRRIQCLILAFILLITAGCNNTANNGAEPPKPKETVNVRFLDPSGNEIETRTVERGASVSPPPFSLEGRKLEGWFSDGYSPAWSFTDPVNSDLELRALCTDTVDTVSSQLTCHDIHDYDFQGCSTNGILVVYVHYTDGHDCTVEDLQKIFTGEHDSFNRLKSVSSYYRYNSYGKADFDFRYVIYDCPLTCKQAYDINQEPNNFFATIFEDIRKNHDIDLNILDKDGNGYVDLVSFISGEDTTRTVGDGNRYNVTGGHLSRTDADPAVGSPSMKNFIVTSYESMMKDPEPASQDQGIRTLIHEIGHAFGLVDYYDFAPYDGGIIDVLGTFDMQSHDVGDWNCFSRFSCGWLNPYLISDNIISVTLKLSCSSENNSAIIIPTSKGFNGTAFDEYLLVDVMAPVGANGYDWAWGLDGHLLKPGDVKMEGGVRIIHVDSRLARKTWKNISPTEAVSVYQLFNSVDEIRKTLNDPEYENSIFATQIFPNSNAYDPFIEGTNRYYHLLDFIPCDGTSKYRICTPTDWSVFWFFSPSDLFSVGETFSMASMPDSFPNSPYANNGGTFDYSVRVDHYDTVNHEAIVTVYR